MTPALRDVSLTLEKGHVLGLLGESGSGKSTLARLVLGLESPDAGQILLEGQAVGIWRRKHRGKMSVVFQDYATSVNPNFTVRDVIAEGYRTAGDSDVDEAAILAAMERAELPAHLVNRLPHQLSGGQLQRVCIARALASRPDFIVFDEAVSALDVSVQTEIVKLLMKIKGNISYLFITHDIQIAAMLCDSIVILNLSAAIKILLAVTVGVLGIVYVARNGFVNDMSAGTFLPSFDLDSLSYISVIIFNFLGFEVVCTYAGSMADPRRQIPQAIVTGGVVIAAIYLFSAFGIGAAVPTRDISVDSGLIDAVSLMTGRTGGLLVGIVALLFLVTLFGNMISWSMGVNSTAAYAAERGDMPAVFARRRKDNDMPVGSALVSGIVASAVCLLGAAIQAVSPDSSLFWSFFALNLVMLLLSYMPVFPAFLALRRKYPQAERPFRVPGGPGMLRVLAYVPMVLIGLSILFTAVPLSTDRETLATILPITVGSVISVLLGELLIAVRRHHQPRSGG